MEKKDQNFTHSGCAGNRVMKNYLRDPDAGEFGDLVSLSWPPRCYTCTFCKREFRSAQALGGHMNVHRRDRALLRQMTSSSSLSLSQSNSSNSPNFVKLNLHPNPNFPPTRLCLSQYSSSSTMQQSCRFGKGGENLALMGSHIPRGVGFCKFHGLTRNDHEGHEVVRWNVLEKGLFGESKADELDLELRLGCS